MNTLFILGNGFDIAHGLKTSYTDFLIRFFQNMCDQLAKEGNIKNDFIKLSKAPVIPVELRRINKIEDFIKVLEYTKEQIIYSDLARFILNHHRNYNWVDIEHTYYKLLTKIYIRNTSSMPNNIFNSEKVKSNVIDDVRGINSAFELLKRELVKYLLEVNDIEKRTIKGVLEIIKNEIETDVNYNKLRSFQLNSKHTLFLNFNYTNTLKAYDDKLDYPNLSFNHIHGEVINENSNIIFGYGDEIDDYYKKFESLNINEFLKNFKSFGYFLDINYKKLIDFIGLGNYKVVILGHSCGLSDRVLFNTILENNNCKSVKVYYHQINEYKNDYYEKTIELSRHFNLKDKMRDKIVSIKYCQPLV